MERKAVTKAQKTSALANQRQTQPARSTSAAHRILNLQQSIGNQAVQRLIGSHIQAKLQVSTPEDPFEREADRVADTVMRMAEPKPVTEKNEKPLQAKSLATGITQLAHRAPEQPLEEEKEKVATKPLVQRAPLAVRDDDEEEKVARKLDPSLSPQEEEKEKSVQRKSSTDVPLQRQVGDDEENEGEVVQAAPLIQRQMDEEEEEVQRKLLSGQSSQPPGLFRVFDRAHSGVIHRLYTECAGEKEKTGAMVQRKSVPEQEKEVSREPGVESQIERLRGGGQQLPESLRAYFEPRFGHDFGGVRLHTGSHAAEAAQKINAKAFTVGNDVAFGAAEYSPETGAGKRLLAHELTHVIQQNGGTPGWLHGARQGLTIQRQTGTDYGLALAGSQNKYVAEAVRLWTTKKTMKVKHFVDALMKAIQTDLLSQGVPELKWQMTPKLGVSGKFDSENWIVSIDPGAFSERQVTEVKDLTLDEVQQVVGTLYHESRHTDQDVLIIRVLLDQKKAVKDIVQETKIPERIVNAVKATKFKTPPDPAQVAHASRMFAVMYGQHKELLEFLMKNTQVFEGVQELVNASDAVALKNAAPHVAKLADWKKNVLEPKVKKLQAGNQGGPVETQLKQDLGALNQVTADLLTDFDTAVKMKNPTEDGLQDLRDRTDEWQKKLFAAYRNLEGEKDALAIEESVKKAFKKGAP